MARDFSGSVTPSRSERMSCGDLSPSPLTGPLMSDSFSQAGFDFLILLNPVIFFGVLNGSPRLVCCIRTDKDKVSNCIGFAPVFKPKASKKSGTNK